MCTRDHRADAVAACRLPRAGDHRAAAARAARAASVVAALAAGFLSADLGGTLELSRTLCFLPFFLLGWRLREGLFADALRAQWSRYAAVAVLGAAFAAAWPLRDEVR
ncbi:hypothetical protein [Streptomyces sp. 6N223]|uniref:hypothetical protein n=1 Tax=Streptomyces sp. 6N223 TaxID=3457412 RepID=UPI003FD656FA